MSIVPNFASHDTTSFACAQTGCPDCLEALLLKHKNLILVVLKRQYPGRCDYADLIQEGWIGLWQAILTFDPNRGAAFSTYAGRVIRNQIWRVVAAGWRKAGWLEGLRATDSLTDLVTIWQQEQIRQAVAEELACLPERLRQVIVLAYGLDGQEPLFLYEIGQQMGLSRERIRQLRNEALVLLRLPALSIRLRSLSDRHTRQDYQQARRLNEAWLSRNRRRK